MEQKYYSLGNNEDTRLVKIMRMIFGFACIAMAVYWALFYLRSPDGGKAMWATVIFILGFGMYQIWAGMGKTMCYIIFGGDFIRMKQHSIQSPETLQATDLTNIEIHPLSIAFFFKSGKKTILRLGAINYETNEGIASSVAAFSEHNNIPCEVKEDKIF